MNQVQYALHPDGFVVSRLDSDFAWPVLDFPAIGSGGRSNNPSTGEDFEPEYRAGDYNGPMRYDLQRFHGMQPGEARLLVWTRKIPMDVKNHHRAFWGLKSLKKETVVVCEKCHRRLPVTEMPAVRVLWDNRHAWSRVHYRCPDCLPAAKKED